MKPKTKKLSNMQRLEKQEFVNHDLLNLLKAIDKTVVNAYYQLWADGKEVVIVQFKYKDIFIVYVNNLDLKEIALKIIEKMWGEKVKKTVKGGDYPYCNNIAGRSCFANENGKCNCLVDTRFKKNKCPFYKKKSEIKER